MQTTTTNGGGIFSKALDTFKAVYPDYLDHRYGRNLNSATPGHEQGYGFAPTTNNQAERDFSAAIYGDGTLKGAVKSPVGIAAMVVGGLLILKAIKVA